MGEAVQDKILQGGKQPYLLTEAALERHNLKTGATELREFACGPCDRFWWRVVLITKPVSRCLRCKVKYNCLPRQKEFGIGRYICQNKTCNQRSFFQRCEASQAMKCRNCNCLVYNPYIHPKFLKSRQERRPLDPQTKAFELPPPSSIPLPTGVNPSLSAGLITLPPSARVRITRVKKKNVINASTRHVSTGSTVDTFITQGTSVVSDLEVLVDSDCDEDFIIQRDLDSSSDDDDKTLIQAEDESEVEVDSEAPMHPSDSDPGSDEDRCKRVAGTDSSDSSSDSDRNEGRLSFEVSSEKLSSQASTILDSGIGTASNVDSTSTGSEGRFTIYVRSNYRGKFLQYLLAACISVVSNQAILEFVSQESAHRRLLLSMGM